MIKLVIPFSIISIILNQIYPDYYSLMTIFYISLYFILGGFLVDIILWNKN
jgi:hypothetical protein